VLKKKITKRRLLEEFDDDSGSDNDVDMMEIVDDESDDNISDDGEICFICEERGKDELWYRCTNCGLWVHSECSGADTAENYTCDICVRAIRKREMAKK
jgi:hypothetical protein